MEERIRIERLMYGSAGVGYSQSGKAIFVENSAPGDVVDVEITEDRPRFSRGHITTLHESSSVRVEPQCPYYGHCGGCSWQHISYPAQLEAKRENIIAALTRSAGIAHNRAISLVEPTLPSKREFGYRNKLELAGSFSNRAGFELGLHAQGSAEIVGIKACPLAQRVIEKTPQSIRGALRYLQSTQDLEIFRVGVRNSLRTGDTEIALWTNPGAFPRASVAKTLLSSCKATSIVRVVAKQGKSRVVKNVEVLEGKGYWEEELCDLRFKTSAPSFFQVNTAQAEKIVNTVLEFLEPEQKAYVADLYAGGGTISLALAQACDAVAAIESASSSVKDLRRNAELNHLDLDIVGGDSGRELPQLGTLDALVVDPPRAGLADGVVESIVATKANSVVYVSCDPATLARDIARFENHGYQLSKVQPIDLFPQTYHVETVVLMSRVKD
ncbi:MAG: 23S rRNA (uracil(1939)-C(5))-methyltransferase RlmD [Raoultibacter sp.]|jgi:23S rRNA (uracil1939-C5)-methyltransferase